MGKDFYVNSSLNHHFLFINETKWGVKGGVGGVKRGGVGM